MREVHLGGAMGTKFGRRFRFQLDSDRPSEAFAALVSQVKGLREYWLHAHKRGIRFAIYIGKRNIPREHFGLPANDTIRIMPVYEGRKNGGLIQTVLGAALLIVAAVFPATAPYLGPLGAGLLIGGITQMLTPVPKGLSSKDAAANQANYNFNGPVNTQAQGNPVPLAYGDVFAGSAVISAGLDTADTVYVAQPHRPRIGFMGGGGWRGILDQTLIEAPTT